MKVCLCLFFAVAAVASTARADTSFSFEGTFTTDDQVQLFDFTLASTETVTFQTWGYGGGTNASNVLIPPGGFESQLTWFGSDGTNLGSSSSCGAGNMYQGACLDAYGEVVLSAGNYTLALTQAGNNANCGAGFPGDLSCGFSEQGQGNYTPIATSDPGCTAFCGTFGTLEDGNWAVDILNVNSASLAGSTPEPATMLLAGCGLALIVLAKRQRGKEKPQNSKAIEISGDRL